MPARLARNATCALLILTLAALVLAGPAVPAQDPPPPAAPDAPAMAAAPGLAEQFPPGTLMVMRTREIEQQLEWMHTGPFGRLVRDPEVKPLWEQLTGMAVAANKSMEDQVGVDLLSVLGSIKGELAMGITRFQLTPSGPSVGFLLALDCGEGAAQVKQATEHLWKMLPPEAYTHSEREVSGVAITTFTPPRKGNVGPDPMALVGAIHTAWAGNVMILGNDKSGFDRLVQVRTGDPQIQTLGQTENWRDTMQRLGGAGQSTMFVNMQGLSELIEPLTAMMPEGVGPVVNALGLDQFPALAASAFTKKDEVVSRMLLRYTGDRKSGLGALMAFRKSDLTVPAWVPEDAMQVILLNYDFQQAFDGVTSLVREAGERPFAGFQEGLDQFQQEFGFSLQDDLLAAFAGSIILVSYPVPPAKSDDTGSDPGNPFLAGAANPTLIGLKIRNRKLIEQFLAFFEQMGAEVSEYLGATIFSAPDFSGEGPLAEAAITNDYLLIGFGPTALVRPTLQRMGGREAGFAAVEGVRDAVAPLPKEGAALIVENYGQSIANSLNMMKALGKIAGDDLAMLARLPMPSSSVLKKHLGWAAGVFLFEPGVGLIADSSWRFPSR